MPRAITLRKEIAYDWFLCECRQCNGGNEFFSTGSYDHLNFGTLFYELADDEATLVSRNRARDAQNNFLSFQHSYRLLNSRRRIRVSTCFVL